MCLEVGVLLKSQSSEQSAIFESLSDELNMDLIESITHNIHLEYCVAEESQRKREMAVLDQAHELPSVKSYMNRLSVGRGSLSGFTMGRPSVGTLWAGGEGEGENNM